MDNKKTLGDKLRERREQLGLGQDYIYTKLDMTQPAYSCIENNKVRFSPQLVQTINSIKGFENFDQPDADWLNQPNDMPVQNGVQTVRRTLASRWRWGKNLLYLVVILVGALLADPLFQIGENSYLGLTGKTALDNEIMALVAVIFLVIYVALIRWIVFRKKW